MVQQLEGSHFSLRLRSIRARQNVSLDLFACQRLYVEEVMGGSAQP